MSFSYPFDRVFLTEKNHFDICYGNPDADPPIIEPRLDEEIQVAIGKLPSIHCSSDACIVEHSVELTSQEETDQSVVVAAHKAAAAGG